MLCVQWPYGDSLECAQHFTRHRATYWPNAPIERKEQKHSDLWDQIITGKRYFGSRENLQGEYNRKGHTCKQLVLSILCCWFVIESQRAQPIEVQCGIDLRPIWNCNSLPNIGHHPLSLCVYSVRSPALPSARTQCRAENIRTRVKSLQMSSILSPITQTWASSLQGTQPNQDIKRKIIF